MAQPAIGALLQAVPDRYWSCGGGPPAAALYPVVGLLIAVLVVVTRHARLIAAHP